MVLFYVKRSSAAYIVVNNGSWNRHEDMNFNESATLII